jgi:hypothetical protein
VSHSSGTGERASWIQLRKFCVLETYSALKEMRIFWYASLPLVSSSLKPLGSLEVTAP